jgi:hypothetical protein
LLSLSNQLHDFNVGLGPDVNPKVMGGNNFGTRVFWTAVVPDRDVQVDPVSGTVQLHVRDLAALDYPEDFGSGSLGPNWKTAYRPATVSFDIVWSRSINRVVTVRDVTDQFAGTFVENHDATVTWSARSDSGFRFQSLPGNLGTSTPGAPDILTTYFFAEVGFERNGFFFDPVRGGDGQHGGSVQAAAWVAGDTLGLGHALVDSWAAPTISGPAVASPQQHTDVLAAYLPAAQPVTAFGSSALALAVDHVFAKPDIDPLADGISGDASAPWTI